MEPPFIACSLDQVPNWIGAAAVVVGVLFGLRQLKDSYQQRDREQQWKRAEFVAEQMKEFFDQRQVHTASPGEPMAFGPEQMLCREAFDAWLTGLETFDHYVQTNLVTAGDLKLYLGYWIQKMADPLTKWKPPSFYQRLAQFIDWYGYKGVQHLCRELGYEI